MKLLFIHGICTGAWVWEPHFLPFFAKLGYDSYALSLRGHGKSEGREKVREFPLSDFADDIAWALGEINGPAVLIGHSFGGGVVQHFVQRGGKAAGAVLVCSAPPHGLLRASAAMYAANPKLAHEMRTVLHQGLGAANLNIIEDGLLSEPALARASPALCRRHQRRCGESKPTAHRLVSLCSFSLGHAEASAWSAAKRTSSCLSPMSG